MLFRSLAAFSVGANVLTLTYSQKASDGRRLLLRLVAATGIAIAAYAASRGHLGPAVISRPSFAGLAVAFALAQAAGHLGWCRAAAAGSNRALEPMRLVLLLVSLLLLHRPLLTAGSIGAGDSYWYRIMAADFVAQFRAGIFPIFVGQSLFAFNGAVSPIRLAPALQHFAGLMDLVTLRTLPINALVNLTLFTAYAAGGATCYLALRRIDPRGPWFAWLLSVLYCSCPGVLALAYTGDLYMSIMALPFIPVVFYGAWRTLHGGGRGAVLTMVAGCAALWYCHPPIAFWCTVVAALFQVGRLLHEWRSSALWRDWLAGATGFVVLTLYCFVSVLSLGLPTPAIALPVLIENLKNAYPASFQPVSQAAIGLGDYQLGWTLWVVLGVSLVGLPFLRFRRPAVLVALATLGLLAVLEPIPGVYDKFWLGVPKAVADLTFMWPMQRLYAILAALVAFGGFLALAPFTTQHPRWSAGVFVILLAGAGWSGLESVKFQQHALAGQSKPAAARNQMRPQNVILTRYAFNPFQQIPPYFSHGYIDPRVPNRLLDRTSLTELASNGAALDENLAGPIVGEGMVRLHTQPGPPAGFTLAPGKEYALRLKFLSPDLLGAMIFAGPRMYRLYWLPHSGFNIATTSPSRAFGILPDLSHTVTLRTDGDVPESISFQLHPNEKPVPDPVPAMASYEIREFFPASLPVVVEGLTPYRARVNPNRPAFLETPRLFILGYRAKVNGVATEVAKSPDALVMVPVPAGPSTVELSFTGPWFLRVAFWTSTLGGLAFAWLGVRRLRQVA